MRKLCQATLKKDVAQAKMEEIVGRQKRHARYRGKFGPTRLNSRLIKAIQIDVHYTFLNEPVPTEVVARFDVPGFGKHLALNFTHPTKGSLRVELSTSEKIQ
jgi:hypothetical protein